jgi:hypothetical protein
MADEYLSRKECAKRTRVCTRLIDNAIYARQLAHVKIGGRVFIAESARQEWLARCTVQAQPIANAA